MMNQSQGSDPSRGEPPRSVPAQAAGIDPDARGHGFTSRMIVNEISDLVPRLTVTGTVNLSSLYRLAQFGGVELDVPEKEIERATTSQALSAIHKVNERLLVPSGVIAIANFVGDKGSLSHGVIDVSSLNPIPTAGGTVFSANVRWERMSFNEPGNSYHSLAIVDPEAAREDTRAFFALLPYLARENPLAELLLRLIRREGVAQASYAELCGTERVRANVVSSAQQHVFLSACGIDTKTSEGALQAIHLLTKPDSGLRLLARPREVSEPWQAQLSSNLIRGYAASLRGIISEIDAAVASDNPGIGHLKAVDFLLTEFHTAEGELSVPNAESMAAAKGKLLTSVLADTGYRMPEGLARVLDLKGRDGCKRVKEICEHLWKRDFRPIEKRVDLVADPAKRAEALR